MYISMNILCVIDAHTQTHTGLILFCVVIYTQNRHKKRSSFDFVIFFIAKKKEKGRELSSSTLLSLLGSLYYREFRKKKWTKCGQ